MKVNPYLLGFVLVAALAVLVRATNVAPPPTLSHDLGHTCASTGCLPAYDGVWDFDGPSGRALGILRYEWTGWQDTVPGFWSFEVFFSPAAFSTSTTEWEVDPSEVCGPSGNWISCACALTRIQVWLEVTTRSGEVVTQMRQTAFMAGNQSEQLDFRSVPGVVSARIEVQSDQRIFFLFEHTGNGFTDMTQCASSIARIRPVATF